MILGRHGDSLEDKRGKLSVSIETDRSQSTRWRPDFDRKYVEDTDQTRHLLNSSAHDAMQSTRHGAINDRQRRRWQRDGIKFVDSPATPCSTGRPRTVSPIRKKSVHLCYDSDALYWSAMGECQINYSRCRIDSNHLAMYQIKPCTSFPLVLAYQRSTWLLIRGSLLW